MLASLDKLFVRLRLLSVVTLQRWGMRSRWDMEGKVAISIFAHAPQMRAYIHWSFFLMLPASHRKSSANQCTDTSKSYSATDAQSYYLPARVIRRLL